MWLDSVCASKSSNNRRTGKMLLCIIFFFSSRRRHTRFDCDWSSDVCSSDLWYPPRIALHGITNKLILVPYLPSCSNFLFTRQATMYCKSWKRSTGMPAATHFTIGIEEEFQIVNRRTGQLSPEVYTILRKGAPTFGEKIKPEMLQSTIEVTSDVLPDIATARVEMQNLRTQLAQLLHEEGLALVSAGTHPSALWVDQKRSLSERYVELEEEYQDVARSVLIFGLHVHIGVDNHELAISLLNQLRTWVPHLLALSSNSPFWCGRFTGIKSYRSVIWRPFPRSGISEPFSSWSDFDTYVQSLIRTGCIDNGKKIWWDVRPHAFYDTIEFRVFDMPANFDDMIALVALCQDRKSVV